LEELKASMKIINELHDADVKMLRDNWAKDVAQRDAEIEKKTIEIAKTKEKQAKEIGDELRREVKEAIRKEELAKMRQRNVSQQDDIQIIDDESERRPPTRLPTIQRIGAKEKLEQEGLIKLI
jgi:hypothetical protein